MLLFPISGMSHEQETLYNQVYLQAQAEREVPNDQMIVLLTTEHEGSDTADLAGKINRDMQWALDIVKQHSFVKSRTKNYQTFPVYRKQEIIGWRASQQLELRSENIAGLSELTGKLQENLLVKQMSFVPTDATRKQYEDELIEEALEAFKLRIAIVKKHMDNKDYRIINININTGSYQPPVVYGGRVQSMEMAAAPPAVESGTSKLTVTVNGSVQFF